jgi:hypothetical protein
MSASLLAKIEVNTRLALHVVLLARRPERRDAACIASSSSSRSGWGAAGARLPVLLRDHHDVHLGRRGVLVAVWRVARAAAAVHARQVVQLAQVDKAQDDHDQRQYTCSTRTRQTEIRSSGLGYLEPFESARYTVPAHGSSLDPAAQCCLHPPAPGQRQPGICA